MRSSTLTRVLALFTGLLLVALLMQLKRRIHST